MGLIRTKKSQKQLYTFRSCRTRGFKRVSEVIAGTDWQIYWLLVYGLFQLLLQIPIRGVGVSTNSNCIKILCKLPIYSLSRGKKKSAGIDQIISPPQTRCQVSGAFLYLQNVKNIQHKSPKIIKSNLISSIQNSGTFTLQSEIQTLSPTVYYTNVI